MIFLKIPLCIPEIGEEEKKLVCSVLESGWLAHGPKAAEFEKKFSEFIGCRHSVSVNSCTSALQLSIEALGLKGEIILPSFTFVASANAIVTAGCTPVFADVKWDSCNIDPESIERLVGEKTVGIMPVHYAGQSCEMDEIRSIAKKHSLAVIEDSAEAIGAEFKGKKTGSFGDTGCFSFFPTKNITTGEGGMVTCNDESLAEKIAALRAHGIGSSTFEREKKERPWFRSASFAGYNYRLCDVLAAIGVVQMDKIDNANERRIKSAEYLSSLLEDVEGIEIPREDKNCRHVYQMYVVKLSDETNRNKFLHKLRLAGIGASVHFDPAVHRQEFYLNKKFRQDNLEVTEKLEECAVTLPMFPSISEKQVEYVAEKVKENL